MLQILDLQKLSFLLFFTNIFSNEYKQINSTEDWKSASLSYFAGK